MTALRRLGFAMLWVASSGLGPALADDSSDPLKTAPPQSATTQTGSAGPAEAPGAPKIDRVKVAIAHRGAWDALVTTFGIEQGLFKAAGVAVEVLWLHGDDEPLQAALAGSADVALDTGILGTIGAYAKGSPVRVVSAAMTGASDLFWYVRADRTPNTIAELAGRTIAYAQPGSPSHIAALALAEATKVRLQFIPTGDLAATRSLVMSGQVDAGWATPPFALDLAAENKIRIVGRGNEAPALADQTARVNVATAGYLAAHREVARRFLKAYAAAVAALAGDADRAVALYARENKISAELARDALAFYPKEALAFLPVKGLPLSLAQALRYKAIDAPMSEDTAKGLIDIVYDPAGDAEGSTAQQ